MWTSCWPPLAPDTVIQLEPGTYNVSGAKGYGLPSENPYYAWTEKYDGFELMLQSVKNLTIRGSGKVNTTLECDPRSASVINLKNCENVTLGGFHRRSHPGTGSMQQRRYLPAKLHRRGP